MSPTCAKGQPTISGTRISRRARAVASPGVVDGRVQRFCSRVAGHASVATITGVATSSHGPRPPATHSSVITKHPSAWPTNGPNAAIGSHPCAGAMARRIRMPGRMKRACETRPKRSGPGEATAANAMLQAAAASRIGADRRFTCRSGGWRGRDAVHAAAAFFHRGADQKAGVRHDLLDRRHVHLARAEAGRALLFTNVLAEIGRAHV